MAVSVHTSRTLAPVAQPLATVTSALMATAAPAWAVTPEGILTSSGALQSLATKTARRPSDTHERLSSCTRLQVRPRTGAATVDQAPHAARLTGSLQRHASRGNGPARARDGGHHLLGRGWPGNPARGRGRWARLCVPEVFESASGRPAPPIGVRVVYLNRCRSSCPPRCRPRHTRAWALWH
jgi:hypothetical protein